MKSTGKVEHDAERSLVGRKDTTLIVDAERLAGRDFFIAQCEGCTILLQGRMGTTSPSHPFTPCRHRHSMCVCVRRGASYGACPQLCDYDWASDGRMPC